MTESHTILSDLITAAGIPSPDPSGKVVFKDDQIRVVVTALARGRELSERGAALSAILQILSGRVHLTLGSEASEFKPGDWAHIPAGLPYSVGTQEPSVLLQTFLPAPIAALFPSHRGRRRAD